MIAGRVGNVLSVLSPGHLAARLTMNKAGTIRRLTRTAPMINCSFQCFTCVAFYRRVCHWRKNNM